MLTLSAGTLTAKTFAECFSGTTKRTNEAELSLEAQTNILSRLLIWLRREDHTLKSSLSYRENLEALSHEGRG